MKHPKFSIFLVAALALAGCSHNQDSKISLSFPDTFAGKQAELITYLDSIVLQADTIRDGKAIFTLKGDDQALNTLCQVMVEGRVRGYLVAEPGQIAFVDSLGCASGTPLNDHLGILTAQMDSVDQYDDLVMLSSWLEKTYQENSDNALAPLFAIEWARFADPERIDSFMNAIPSEISTSPRAQKYVRAAQLRAATAPGKPYVDFEAPQPDGKTARLSDFVKSGRYTIVDFWASWCPYCIKELPQLAELYNRYAPQGVDIVGVAVRDSADDTRAAVDKHSISWPVMYNAQRVPYDIYGFNGIPHHILIGPDGTIISRGENTRQLSERLQTLLGK